MYRFILRVNEADIPWILIKLFMNISWLISPIDPEQTFASAEIFLLQDEANDDLSLAMFLHPLLLVDDDDDDDDGGRAGQVHVRHVREQLDALHHEVPHGGIYD